MSKKVVNWKKYLMEKAIVGNGIVNGIVNGYIFYLLNKSATEFTGTEFIFDIALTSVLLGALLFYIVIPLTKKDIVKKDIDTSSNNGHIAALLGTKRGVVACKVSAVTFFVTMACLAINLAIFDCGVMSLTSAMISKGILCSIAGGVASYLTNTYVAATMA